MKTKEDYEKMGWKFDTEVWINYHNGNEEKSTIFRSPRMNSFYSYDGIENLDKKEAYWLATEVKSRYCFQGEIIEILKDYFLKNKDVTEAPKLEIKE